MPEFAKKGALALLALVVAGCAAAPPAPFPGEEWAWNEGPAMSGDRQAALEAAVAAGPTHSMVVVQAGKVVFTFGDIEQTDGTYWASVRKSILAMLYGDSVDKGLIDIDATLADLGIDDVGGLTEIERLATIRDLISARSGVYHPASNDSGVTEDGPRRGEHAPGEFYWYNNWDFNAAGAIFEKQTHTDIYTAFSRQFAQPMQMQDFELAAHLAEGKSGDLDQSQFHAYHFFLSTRDAARLGVLMLNEGRWRGKRLIPRDWVRESTSIITPNAEMNPESFRQSGFGYGYMWWVFDSANFPPAFKGGYVARGHFGQYILVLPAKGLVIAHKTLPAEYKTPEEYEAINVTWDEFRRLVDLTLAAMDG